MIGDNFIKNIIINVSEGDATFTANKRGETHLTRSSLTGIIRLRINPIVLLVIELRKKREIDKPPSISEHSLGGANNWAILLLARANKQLGRDECNCGIRLTERTIIPRFLVPYSTRRASIGGTRCER